MAKEMGEFEERPKMQEATPIPLRRRRPTGWIIATIAFAVIAIAAISFVIIDKTSSKPEVANECVKDDNQTAEKELQEPKPSEGDIEEEPQGGSEDDEEGEKPESKSDDGADPTTNVSENAKTSPVIVGSTGLLKTASVGDFYITKSGEVYLDPIDKPFDNGYETDYLLRPRDYDQKKLPGKYGKYTITKDNVAAIGSGLSDGKAPTKVTFYGYKLNISNIVSMFGPLNFGQAWNGYNYAFVSKSGTVDWLNIVPGMKTADGYDMKASSILTKKVGGHEGVASVMVAYNAGANTVVFIKKDGGHIWLGSKITQKLEGFSD